MECLLDVYPAFSLKDTDNGRALHAIATGQRTGTDSAGCVLGPKRSYFFSREFCLALLLAAQGCPAMFAVAVGVVVQACTQKKMGGTRIATSRVVAVVKHAEPVGNGATGNGPRDTVCAVDFGGVVCPRTKPKQTIALRQFGCYPRPTFIEPSDAHLAPKAQKVLRSQWRDDTVGLNHDSLLHRDSWPERPAASSVGRSLSPQTTQRNLLCQAPN